MMKDKNCGKIMKEFVGLRSKMYSFKTVDMEEVKKSKGVKISCVKNLSLVDYKDHYLKEKSFLSQYIHLDRSFISCILRNYIKLS